MEVGDKIKRVEENFEVISTLDDSFKRNDFVGRVIKYIEGNIFQLDGDYSTWLYVKDFDPNYISKPNYEIF